MTHYPSDPQTYLGKILLATPSAEQCSFFTFLVNDSRSAILSAVAGSGKTTTIVEGCRLLPKGVSARFLAFNKSIADTLATQLPVSVPASTFHSAWFSSLQRHLPSRPKVDKDKVRNLFKEQCNDRKANGYKEFDLYFKFVCRLVGYAKNVGLGTSLIDNSLASWFHLISHFNLFLDSDDADEGVAVRYAQELLAASNIALKSIDFDDMLYLPLLKNISCDKTNFVFVDEAQDLNGVQRELLKRMLPKVGSDTVSRLIAVGDPHQAIYGFRGADNDSLDILQSDFSAVRLPLSVSYRCSKAVVSEAQRVLDGTW